MGARGGAQLVALVAAAFTLASSCTTRNPLYCSEEQICTEAETPYCDLHGEYQKKTNTCIANPFGPCETIADCTDALAPLCDPDVGCVPCTMVADSDRACTARSAGAPICNADGRCIACTDDTECPNSQPICDPATLTCGPCTRGAAGNVQCAIRGGTTALCSDFGACIECVRDSYCDDPLRPVCGEDGLCRGCIENTECESGVCDRDAGACADPSTIYYVTGEFPSLAAFEGYSWVKIQTDTALVSAGPNIPIVGSEGTVISAGVFKPKANVEDVTIEANLLFESDAQGTALRRVRVIGAVQSTGGTDNTIELSQINAVDPLSGSLSIIRSEVSGAVTGSADLRFSQTTFASTSSIDRGAGSITIERCELRGIAADPVVTIDGADYAIRNSFFVENEGSAVHIVSAAPTAGIFEFNTIAENSGTGVICEDGTTVNSNNIVWGNSVAQVAGACPWSYSIVQGGTAGAGNLSDDPIFFAPLLGDYHLGDGSPAIDAADPNSQDTIDFDGDDRPAGPERDIGADEYRP